jgi:hypothetical protein
VPDNDSLGRIHNGYLGEVVWSGSQGFSGIENGSKQWPTQGIPGFPLIIA